MKPYQHFNLVRPPFEASPDPRVFFAAPSHGETLATLEYSVYANKTCTVVIGESGSGKSLLARLIAARAGRRTSVLWVHGIGQPNNDVTEVSVFSPGSLSASTPEPAVQQTTLAKWTRLRHRFPYPPLLIVDDADDLPKHGWRDIISLVSREVLFPRPVNLVLFGIPRLMNLIASPELTRLRRRVFRTCALRPLSCQQVGGYVDCRLAAAGALVGKPPVAPDTEIFSPEAIIQAHQLTKGNPGLISQVCDNAILEAFSAGRTRVTDADTIAAARAIVGAQHTLLPGPGVSISLGGGAARRLPSTGRRPVPQLTVDSADTGVGRYVARGEQDSDTVETNVGGTPGTPVDKPPVAPGARVVHVDVKDVEQRLSYLETRLGNAITAVRHARLRHDAAADNMAAKTRPCHPAALSADSTEGTSDTGVGRYGTSTADNADQHSLPDEESPAPQGAARESALVGKPPVAPVTPA